MPASQPVERFWLEVRIADELVREETEALDERGCFLSGADSWRERASRVAFGGPGRRGAIGGDVVKVAVVVVPERSEKRRFAEAG